MKTESKTIEKHIKSSANNNQLFGLEIEHFILDDNNKSVYYKYHNDKAGVADILEELSVYYKEKIYENFNGQKHLVGLKRDDAEISIEPGAQFEVSFPPVKEMEEVESLYAKFHNEVTNVLTKHNYHLENIGYRPDACALEVPLIPKMRYACMDANFKTVDDLGCCMMRCSAATQVSIDFKDEVDCIKKLKVATILSPLFYFLFDNSPIFERTKVADDAGKSVSGITVPKRMARYHIWNHTDNDRCTSHSEIFKQDFEIEDYVKIICDLPKIYNPENLKSDKQKAQHELSMCFYDARLKNTIEIRSADSMPIGFTLAFVELIKKLFYNIDNLDLLYELAYTLSFKDYKAAGQSLLEDGWNAQVYGMNIDDFLEKIFDLADAKNNKYLLPCLELIDKKLCLKDYLKTNFTTDKSSFNPISKTEENTKFQADLYNNTDLTPDMKSFLDFHQNSKGTCGGKVGKCGYFIKAFDLSSHLQFQNIIYRLTSILDKVIDHYYEDKKYAKLFKFDDFSQKLINFKPRYSRNIPIARYDVFFDDKTGNYKFCEFNTGGTAAMSKAQFFCEEIVRTEPYKQLNKKITNAGKSLKTWELFNSWVYDFLEIYKEWCTNMGRTYTKPNIGMVDFLDNCQIADFEPFKLAFEKAGCNCEICDVRDLIYDGKKLKSQSGQSFDAIYKRVTLNDLINFKDDDGVKAMVDAVLTESVCPIDWYSTQIVHDKQICYILRDPKTKEFLKESEISFIEKNIPQTYRLNKECKKIDEILNNKNKYIIKPINGRDSIGIYSGRDLNNDVWKDKVEKCVATDNYIAQEFCKIYTSDNVIADIYDQHASLNDGIKQFSNMDGLYCYNNEFRGLFLRQGDHKEDSTSFDICCPCFYEDNVN